MSWLDGLRHRLRSLRDPEGWSRDLDEEMRFHRELDSLQQGDPVVARRRFGNHLLHAEETRRMTWLRFTDTARQDLRYAWRSVARAPGLTAVVVTMLAVGIGITASAFSLIDALYLRPPAGVHRPSEVRRLWMRHYNTGNGLPYASQALTVPMVRRIGAATGDSARLATYLRDTHHLGRGLGGPEVRIVYASANYFDVLGVRAALGRLYGADEDRLGSGVPVAVVSDAFWRRVLGADPGALGRTLEVGRSAFTVIGVLDPAFQGLDLEAEDLWIPLAAMPAPRWIEGPWWESLHIYAVRGVLRRPDGLDEQRYATAATQAVRGVEREQRTRPDTLLTVLLGGLIESHGPGEASPGLVIATRIGGVALVALAIAWANVVNLLLARALRRRRETAVHLALGISHWRLVRLATLEVVLLAMLASGAALLVAWGGGTGLRRLILPDIAWAGSALDARVALFTAALALAAGLAAGLVTAHQATRLDLTRDLKDGLPADGARSRLRGGLIMAQAALSVVLLVGAALFVRSLMNVRALDIGYDADRLLFGRVRYATDEEPPAGAIGRGMRDVAEQLRGHPGIESVARMVNEPMGGFAFGTFYTATDSSASLAHRMPTMAPVSPEYFQTAGIRLLRGRGFTVASTDSGPAEVIVNDAAAGVLWPGQDALGQCMHFKTRTSPCYTVVGVVETVRREGIVEPEPKPQFYLPLAHQPWPLEGANLMVRTRVGGAKVAAAEVRAALRAAFPWAEPDVVPMMERLAPQYRRWSVSATLFSGLGVLALLVAMLGIYSMVTYSVVRRTHEFGVRVALGARVHDVVRQVVGESLRTVLVGVLVGVGLSLAAGRFVTSMLYGIRPSDPAVLVATAAALLLVAAAAALPPAWRAARLDPVVALRSE
jgi:predicted permease